MLKLDIKSKYLSDKITPSIYQDSGPPTLLKGKGGVFATRIEQAGLPETQEVLGKFGKAISIYAARAISLVTIDLLANAQPRVPVDTGELRESGVATLKMGRGGKTYIGIGHADGTIEARLGNVTKSKLKNVRTLRAEVSYRRLNEEGADIALWAHEDLLPYSSSQHPRARTLGTGPKYLEIPWIEKAAEYIRFINDEVAGLTMKHNIALISKMQQTRTGKYKVNYVDLNIDKIQVEGYYPPGWKH